ncbi:MAG: hypothetical protein M3Z64_05060 [Verrucomicrobiota bacterium]|nr:hypothetical protein [Verrucomicrobiota bacterium]
MTPDELKQLWSQADTKVARSAVTPELICRLAKESARFDRKIFWRDAREWVATIFVVGMLLRFALIAPRIHWPLIAAALIACVPMVYVTLGRRKRTRPNAAAPLREHLCESIAEVQHQFDLLTSVARWYLGPLGVSAAILLFDRFFSLPRSAPPPVRHFLAGVFVIGALFTAAVFYAVWKMNQVAARKRLAPRLRRLRETLAALDE